MTVPAPPSRGADASGGASWRASVTAVRDARLAWIIGGSLLIALAVVPLITQGMPVPVFGIVPSMVWAGALAVFAFGVRGQGSVVARRPLGVTALVVAALIPLAELVFWALVPTESYAQGSLVPVGQGIRVVSLVALVIATVQIARAGVVPSRFRWVPLILVGASAATQAAVEGVAIATPGVDQVMLLPLFFVARVVPTLATLALGILAIVLAPRVQDVARVESAVQVFPPADPPSS